MQDDEGGERVWVPTIPVGWDGVGFRPPPPPAGGVRGPETLVLKLVPTLVMIMMERCDAGRPLSGGDPRSKNMTGKITKKNPKKTIFLKN